MITEEERQQVSAYRAQREQNRKRRVRRRRWIAGGGVLILVIAVWGGYTLWHTHTSSVDLEAIVCPEWIEQALLDIDGEARSGRALTEVRDIAIHYVGNPDTSAMANRNYFNKPETDVSSHFIVGLEGEIVQCIPLNERAVATNDRNGDTIAIEVCHPDETGKFSDTTYAALVKLTAWLCEELHLDGGHLIRHYDVTGKLCPLYYVEHEDAWQQFKQDVTDRLQADTITADKKASLN